VLAVVELTGSAEAELKGLAKNVKKLFRAVMAKRL
jgi:hypothetical protein